MRACADFKVRRLAETCQNIHTPQRDNMQTLDQPSVQTQGCLVDGVHQQDKNKGGTGCIKFNAAGAEATSIFDAAFGHPSSILQP